MHRITIDHARADRLHVRAKWSGRLMPSLHCDPADADCDPENTGPDSE